MNAVVILAVQTLGSPRWPVSCSQTGGCHWVSCTLKKECCIWKTSLGDGEETHTSDNANVAVRPNIWISKRIKNVTAQFKDQQLNSMRMHAETTQCVWFVLDIWRSAGLPLQWVWSGTDELLYFPLESGLWNCTYTLKHRKSQCSTKYRMYIILKHLLRSWQPECLLKEDYHDK